MRLRSTVAAALAAAALVLPLPASAEAAQGQFSYVFHDRSGGSQFGVIDNPPSHECLTLPETRHDFTPPADSPRNSTEATAEVFTGVDCTGDVFRLRPFGERASERLKLRSVRFL